MLPLIRNFSAVFALILTLCFSVKANAKLNYEVHSLNQYHFTTPPGLESKVEFWKKIYSEYSTKHVVIHDIRNLDIVYEVVFLGEKRLSRRSRERKLAKTKKKYRNILRKLAKVKNTANLSNEEKRVYKLVGKNFYKAS